MNDDTSETGDLLHAGDVCILPNGSWSFIYVILDVPAVAVRPAYGELYFFDEHLTRHARTTLEVSVWKNTGWTVIQ